ncbi:hypothetical protein K1719_000086 [Acacia pycnantha]|nr:hypothetical protein K1719_000086 [Acacia pycnantha]
MINTELDTQLNPDSGHSDCVHSIDLSDSDSDSISDSLVSTNSDIMAGEHANHHTLKELGAPDVNYQPLCIQYPDLAANFELKSGLIHLLPKFHGLAGECPIKHLKEFHVVCNTMKPHAIHENHIKIRPSNVVKVSAGASHCEFSSLNSPLEPKSHVGRFLSGVLWNHRQMFHVAVSEELKLLVDDRDAAVARMALTAGSDEDLLQDDPESYEGDRF